METPHTVDVEMVVMGVDPAQAKLRATAALFAVGEENDMEFFKSFALLDEERKGRHERPSDPVQLT